jgi:hypothetical protein
MASPTPTRGRGVSGLLVESGGGGVEADTMDQTSKKLLSHLSRHINITLQEFNGMGTKAFGNQGNHG